MKFKIGPFQWSTSAELKRLAALVLVALIALVAGVSLIVRIVRLPAPPQTRPAQVDAATSLNLARFNANQPNQLLNEKAQLDDPTPLFLPTPYNSSQVDNTAILRHEPGEAFPRIAPRFAYPEDSFAITIPNPLPLPAQPVDVLDYGRTQTPYAQFGRIEHPEKPLPARMAQLEVVQMKTGRTVLALPLAQPAAPVALPEALATANWKPLEFLVALDVAGMVGAPTLVRNPDFDSPAVAESAVADFFANYLVKTLHIDARRELAPGFYLLRVAP